MPIMFSVVIAGAATDDILMWSRSVLQPRGKRIVIISHTCGIATKIRRITAGLSMICVPPYLLHIYRGQTR